MKVFVQPQTNRVRRGAVPFRVPRFIVPALLLASMALRIGAETAPPLEVVISGIDNAQLCREQRLKGYTAAEKYTVRNSHFDGPAELLAKVTYQKGIGKTYKVISRSGPPFLQRRVLDRILKDDAELSRPRERQHTLLISTNYAMNVQGTEVVQGRLCYVIGLHPRKHNFSLIDGKAWVAANDFSLLRVQGKPAASPSFWTGRPSIERGYMLIDGLSFAQHSRATSKGFFTGKSELDIEYSDYALSLSAQ